jgi:hypothetical protein
LALPVSQLIKTILSNGSQVEHNGDRLGQMMGGLIHKERPLVGAMEWA